MFRFRTSHRQSSQSSKEVLDNYFIRKFNVLMSILRYVFKDWLYNSFCFCRLLTIYLVYYWCDEAIEYGSFDGFGSRQPFWRRIATCCHHFGSWKTCWCKTKACYIESKTKKTLGLLDRWTFCLSRLRTASTCCQGHQKVIPARVVIAI